MSKQQEMHFKETTPIETVAKLKKILQDMDIELDEEWQDESCIGTYALRTVFKGTGIGTNGKGISKEFALASSYAEFFERYENNMLTYGIDGNELGYDFHIAPDEKIQTAHEIVQSNNAFIKQYFRNRNMENETIENKTNAFKQIHRAEYIIYNKEDYFVCVPFFSIKENKNVYLPQNIYRMFYGSNGMCAGNKPEEAIVQGLSEIFERNVQKKLFLEKPTLPDIPEDYIKKFPYIYDMFCKLKKNKGFKYFLKDCSFGGKYPVAALIILEENTGSYGIKLGCHPDYGIAMERTFTEAAQGQDILSYAKRSQIDFQNNGVEDNLNICNTYKVGLGQFPYQLFGSKPSWNFKPFKDVSNMSNKKILNDWIKEINNDGYDVLIRNVSNLGFPAFHIIIPGISEMTDISEKYFRAYNTRHYVSSLLLNPEKINKDNCKYIRGTLEYFLNSLLENSITSYRPRVDNINVPAESFCSGSLYLIAMCYVYEGNYLKASEVMNSVYLKAVRYKVNNEEVTLYKGMYYYLSAMNELKDFEKVMSYMKLLFDCKICDKIESLLKKPNEIFIRQYGFNSKDDKFSKAHKIYAENIGKLLKSEIENPTNQEEISKLLS